MVIGATARSGHPGARHPRHSSALLAGTEIGLPDTYGKLSAGSDVEVLYRPEPVRLTPDPGGSFRLTGRAFPGAVSRATLAGPADVVLTAAVPCGSGGGDRFTIAFDVLPLFITSTPTASAAGRKGR